MRTRLKQLSSARSSYLAALLVCALSGTEATAQTTTKYAEKVTAVTPLTITKGFNADVIAEKKATSKDDYTESKSRRTTYYTSKYATFIDSDGEGGWNAFYTKGVQEDGAIKYTNDDYLDGNTDNQGDHPLKYKLAKATEKNALLLTSKESVGTLELKPAEDGKEMPAASMIYLLATSAEGATTITVTIYGTNDNEVLGTTTATIGDWWSNFNDEKLTQVYQTKRITVKGTNTNGNSEKSMNYVNGGHDNSGIFYLQRIGISTKSDQPVGKITITRDNSSKGNAVILAATAVTEEVTLEDTETSLDYLKNESTHQRIAEGTKSKVNFIRTFYADNEDGTARWQPLIFCCPLTVKQAKTMFGDGIKVSVATDQSYQQNHIVFYPVEQTNDDAQFIEPGKYYLISGITTNKDNTYSHTYLDYKNPADKNGSFSDTPADFTVTNEAGKSITFHGTYVDGKTIGTGSYALSGGKFYKYTDNPTIKGFRFWFTADGTTSDAPATYDMVVASTTVTGISEIGNSSVRPNNDNVYTMDGRLVRSNAQSLDGLAKGLYIVGGKKIIVK